MSIARNLVRGFQEYVGPYLDDVAQGAVSHVSRSFKRVGAELKDTAEGLAIHIDNNPNVIHARGLQYPLRIVCLKPDPLRLSSIGMCQSGEVSLASTLAYCVPVLVAAGLILLLPRSRKRRK